MDVLLHYFDNVDWADIWVATSDTMLMLSTSLLFTVLVGLPLGILLFLFSPRQLLEQKTTVCRPRIRGQRHPLSAVYHSADRDDPHHGRSSPALRWAWPVRFHRWW
jgi:hypothetical protein